MDDIRAGAGERAVRIRRGCREQDVADRAGVSRSLVSLVERGHIGATTISTLRAIAAALDIRIDLIGRWRGGQVDRLWRSTFVAAPGGGKDACFTPRVTRTGI